MAEERAETYLVGELVWLSVSGARLAEFDVAQPQTQRKGLSVGGGLHGGAADESAQVVVQKGRAAYEEVERDEAAEEGREPEDESSCAARCRRRVPLSCRRCAQRNEGGARMRARDGICARLVIAWQVRMSACAHECTWRTSTGMACAHECMRA